jgi:AraC-like DNA-binding protein
MLDLVRAASLTHFEQVVEEFGGDPIALLQEIGLSPKLLNEPEMLYRYYDFIRLMNLASETLNQEAFGLHLGCRQGFSMFGSMGYLLKNCRTVGDSLSNLRRFFHVHQTSADVGLSISKKSVKLSYAINIDVKTSAVQALDVSLALGINLLKTLTSSKINIKSIHLQHAAPADKKRYKNYLGLTPFFNSTFNGVIFDACILDRAIDEADPQIFAILSTQLNLNNVGYVDEIPNFVETIIRQNIAVALISIDDVAHHMSLSVRNLQRYLKEQDTSFRHIVDNVRNKLAYQYLIDSTLSLSRVSDQLGFSNYSEFSRAFKRLNEVSPKEFRNTHSPRKRFTRLKTM